MIFAIIFLVIVIAYFQFQPHIDTHPTEDGWYLLWFTVNGKREFVKLIKAL